MRTTRRTFVQASLATAAAALLPSFLHAQQGLPARRPIPSTGEALPVVGCGTSWFMALAYANLREASGQGETDAFAGSEVPAVRPYDRIVAPRGFR